MPLLRSCGCVVRFSHLRGFGDRAMMSAETAAVGDKAARAIYSGDSVTVVLPSRRMSGLVLEECGRWGRQTAAPRTNQKTNVVMIAFLVFGTAPSKRRRKKNPNEIRSSTTHRTSARAVQ